MIGFNYLGKHGRLGNQMFQYAGLRGIAEYHGYEFAIPDSNFKNEWTEHQLFEVFKLDSLKNIQFVSGPNFQEKHFHFDNDLFEKTPDNCNVHGYFQSEKYFKHIDKQIRDDFQFIDEIYDPCKESIESLDDPIALHVRRTDYVNHKDHPTCSKEYYDEALSKFDSNRTVIIFSDDSKFCMDAFPEDRFLVAEGNINSVDLCMMSLCSDFIIANSSFSWWGSWLSKNPDKKTIAPSRWFGEGYTSANKTHDLYCENWEII